MSINWENYENQLETSEHIICFENAKKYGYSPFDTELCDEGKELCPECPFLKRKEKQVNANES